MFVRCAYLILFFLISSVSCETRSAIARLVSKNIIGTIEFTETTAGLRVNGSIIGLPAGNYGFHVHALGDISTCDASGPHFNPDRNTHGGRDHSVRHVGDLGNVLFVGNGAAVADVDFVDKVISLRGRNSILGRTLMLHEQEDDLGLGENENSLTTGNAGPRVACGVIGIKSPGEPWNAATTVSPSMVLFLLVVSFVFHSM